MKNENRFFIILGNEPFSTNFKIKMNGIKRILSAEDVNDNDEQLTIPKDSPDSKKFRHASLHSENEEDTQIIDSENGIINSKITKII
jgi:hypothetical protein